MTQKTLMSQTVKVNDNPFLQKDASRHKLDQNIISPSIHKRCESESAVKDYFLLKQQLRRDLNNFRGNVVHSQLIGPLCLTESPKALEKPNKPSRYVNQEPKDIIKRIYLPEVRDSKPQSPQSKMISSHSPIPSPKHLTNSPFSSSGFDSKMANHNKTNIYSRNFEQDNNRPQVVESPLGRSQFQFSQLTSSNFSPYLKKSQKRK